MREKQRLFKMTEIERNVLVKGLHDHAVAVHDLGGNYEAVNALIRKAMAVTNGKLFLDELEYDYAVQGMRCLKNEYLAEGRYSGGIDRVMLKIMTAKYKRVPSR